MFLKKITAKVRQNNGFNYLIIEVSHLE